MPAHPLYLDIAKLGATLTQLTRLTHQEAELLAHARIDELKDVLRHKASLIKEASVQREACRGTASHLLGVTLTPHARLAMLVDDVALFLHDTNQREEHDMLTSEWQAVVCTLEELERAQARSEHLARQGMTWIEGCLDHLTQPSQSSTNTTYTRHGKAHSGASSFIKRQA